MAYRHTECISDVVRGSPLREGLRSILLSTCPESHFSGLCSPHAVFRWFQQHRLSDIALLILFIDEELFDKEGVTNFHSIQFWEHNNSHDIHHAGTSTNSRLICGLL